MNSGGQIQVVIGNQVDNVYQAVLKNSDIKKDQKESEDQGGEKKNIINVLMETISGIFAPALGILAGAGTIKAFDRNIRDLSDLVCSCGWNFYIFANFTRIYGW